MGFRQALKKFFGWRGIMDRRWNRIAKSTILLTWILLAAGAALAQNPAWTTLPEVKHADELFQAKNWAQAATAFAEITRTHPENGYAWFRLANCYQALGQYEQALDTYETARQKGAQSIPVQLRKARTLALMGQRDKALEILKQLTNGGFAQAPILKTEPDFASLREDARFAEILAAAERNAHPCSARPEYRQFDFWIGEWNVVSTQGEQPAGTSSIQQILDSCVILENWSGAGGGSGKSFNIFDAAQNHWEQIWVDAFGSLTKFVGGIQIGVMDYRAESVGSDGKKTLRRLRFAKLDADRVRQWSVMSTDDGKTWTPEYDLTYIRKK
jgi:tetratricopeptide repeat protein